LPRREEVENRVELLLRDFEQYVLAFDGDPAFTKPGQYQDHAKTIRSRADLGSVSAAIQNAEFLNCLQNTLVSWGIGSRGSHLVESEQFVQAIQEHASAIAELGEEQLDDPGLRVQLVMDQAWTVIDSLGIDRNKAKLVPCTKALHHLLPELIVPMDREYTRTFFGWHVPEFQYQQERIFRHAFERFVRIARTADPRQFVGSGWQTSITKVIDNALVAFCRIHKLQRPS
jgi:hypothetical protein